MDVQDYLTILSILFTIIIAVISWVVSAYQTKKSLRIPKLTYEIRIFPIISKEYLNNTNELKITFQDELLPEPTLLAVDIVNTGDVAIEQPPIRVEAVGATYVIPGYIEDIPPGYEEIWSLERTDAEECAIHIEHINPGQVVKARFFLDELPKEMPLFKCPMKDLILKEINTDIKEVVVKSLFEGIKLGIKGVFRI